MDAGSLIERPGSWCRSCCSLLVGGGDRHPERGEPSRSRRDSARSSAICRRSCCGCSPTLAAMLAGARVDRHPAGPGLVRPTVGPPSRRGSRSLRHRDRRDRVRPRGPRGPRGSCAAGAGAGPAAGIRGSSAASSVGLTEPKAAPNRTGQRSTSRCVADDRDGPVEIAAVADDDLDLVGRLEPVEVAPDVGLGLARAGRLDVEDDRAPAGSTAADVNGPAGLQQHGLAGVGQAGHQRVDLRLEQRLAAGELDQVVAQLQGSLDDLVEAQDCPSSEGVRRVAVDAAQVAGGQPDEDARQPGERALALEAAVDLVDHQRPGRLALQRPEPLRWTSWIGKTGSATPGRPAEGVVRHRVEARIRKTSACPS